MINGLMKVIAMLGAIIMVTIIVYSPVIVCYIIKELKDS